MVFWGHCFPLIDRQQEMSGKKDGERPAAKVPGRMQTGDVMVPVGPPGHWGCNAKCRDLFMTSFVTSEMRICGKYCKQKALLPPGAFDCVQKAVGCSLDCGLNIYNIHSVRRCGSSAQF